MTNTDRWLACSFARSFARYLSWLSAVADIVGGANGHTNEVPKVASPMMMLLLLLLEVVVVVVVGMSNRFCGDEQTDGSGERLTSE